MKKSIFLKLTLIIIPIVLVLDFAVLGVAYGIIYDATLDSCDNTIKGVASMITEITTVFDFSDKKDVEYCNENLTSICEAFELTYAYVLEPDTKTNADKYISIGFGKDASEEAKKERYPGVVVDGIFDDEQKSVYNSHKKDSIIHINNQFGDMLVCYMGVAERLNFDTGKTEKLDKPLIAGAEINVTQVMNQFRKRYTYIVAFTIGSSLLIVFSVFLVLYFKVSKPARRISNRMKSFVADRENGFEKLSVKGHDEFSEMSGSYNSMAEEIDRYIKDNEALTRQKHTQEAELSISRTIQKGLLKPSLFKNDSVEISALMQAAKNVGGDLYDYQVLEDGKVFIAIADVSGKGVYAALFMARAITLLHQYALLGYPPGKMLSEYNDTLAEQNPNSLFITTFVAVYDPETGKLTYSNAGHNHPYILSDRLIELDGAPGMAAGVFGGEKYGQETIALKPGDVVFLYTDGVNEAENSGGKLLGTDSLEKELSNHLNSKSDNITEAVLQKITDFSGDADQSDDITMLAMRVVQAPVRRELTVDSKVENLPGIVKMITDDSGLSEAQIGFLTVIVEEIFVNICYYAYGDKTGPVKVGLEADSESVSITFKDSGKPFDPTADVLDIEDYDHQNAMGGLGRYLAFELADDYSYSYTDGQNILRIKKNNL